MIARLKKFGLWLLVILLVLLALSYFGESMRTISVPHTSYSGAGYTSSHLSNEAWRGNGLNFLAGLSLLWLALRAGNAATRKAGNDSGGVDRLLAANHLRSARWIPLALSVACFGALAVLLSTRFSAHTTAEAAARAFHAEVSALSIQANGDYVYGLSMDGSVLHVAAFTPALVRAFRAADLPIGETIADIEFPVPGLLPLLILLGAIVLWSPRPAWQPRLIVLAGLVSSYVLLWTASTDSKVTIFDAFTLNPDWFGAATVVACTQLSQLGVLHRNRNWLGLYCLGTLAALAWTYHFSGATVFALALFWFLPFAGLLCLFWWRTTTTPAGAAS